MKFNWGTGLFIFILVFISLCVVFMIFAFHQNVNLVQEGYYEKGVDFDKQIDMTERSVSFKDQISIENINEQVVVSLPDSFLIGTNDAEVFFYRPSDNHNDLRIKMISDTLVLPKDKFVYGRYIVKISWTKNNKQFIVEKEFIVK